MGAHYDFNTAAKQQPEFELEEVKEALAKTMVARQAEFTAAEKIGDCKEGFFAGLNLLAHMAGNIVHLELPPWSGSFATPSWPGPLDSCVVRLAWVNLPS